MYTVQTVAVTPNEKRGRSVSPETKEKDRIRQAKYRSEHRYEPTTELSKRSQHLKRVRALMLFGGKCKICNNNDMRVLHFDHINNDGNISRKEYGRHDSQIKRVFSHPDEYQVLCANCHEIKHTKYLDKE